MTTKRLIFSVAAGPRRACSWRSPGFGSGTRLSCARASVASGGLRRQEKRRSALDGWASSYVVLARLASQRGGVPRRQTGRAPAPPAFDSARAIGQTRASAREGIPFHDDPYGRTR